MAALDRNWSLEPRFIAGLYVLFGVGWILLTDQLVVAVANTTELAVALQTVKGWVFVGLSGVVIFVLTRRRERQLKRSRKQEATATQELQVLHRLARHNVRNDLTVIHGYAEQLEGSVTESGRKPRERIVETAESLANTIEKLRVINRIDVETEAISRIDVIAILEAEIDRLRKNHPDITIELSVPDRLLVLGEPTLREAIREVLENAMAHHDQPPQKRTVWIEAERGHERPILRIADDGPGIPADEIDPVADGEETPLYHSSGVGLWLVDWICRSQNCESDIYTSNGRTVVEFEFDRPATGGFLRRRIEAVLGSLRTE